MRRSRVRLIAGRLAFSLVSFRVFGLYLKFLLLLVAFFMRKGYDYDDEIWIGWVFEIVLFLTTWCRYLF